MYSNIHAYEGNLHDIMHCFQTYEYCYEDECYKNQGQEWDFCQFCYIPVQAEWSCNKYCGKSDHCFSVRE